MKLLQTVSPKSKVFIVGSSPPAFTTTVSTDYLINNNKEILDVGPLTPYATKVVEILDRIFIRFPTTYKTIVWELR